jgi:uncharacterized protein YodC (DUF2158 family)
MAFAKEAGVKLDATYASAGDAPFSVGTVVDLNDGGKAMLVESSASACSTFAAVVVKPKTGIATMLTTGVARSGGNIIGFAQTSIGTGRVGWIHLGGKPKVNLAADCASFVNLYTTATPGVLDDATVSGSGGLVVGIFAATSISTATAATCVGGIGSGFAIAVVGS